MSKASKILLITTGVLCVLSVLAMLGAFFAQKQSLKTSDSAKADKIMENAVNDVSIPSKIDDAATGTVPPVSKTDHSEGSLDAPVQVIVYSDFSCPFCAEFYDVLEKVKTEFKGQIVIAFRHFPLQSHIEGIPAALASECAAEQGKFWEMYRKLFENNKNAQLNEAQYRKDAAEIGLDEKKFNGCFDGKKYKEKIAQSVVNGRDLGIMGTPTVYVNKEILPGAYPFQDFTGSDGTKTEGMKSVIERKLKKNKS